LDPQTINLFPQQPKLTSGIQSCEMANVAFRSGAAALIAFLLVHTAAAHPQQQASPPPAAAGSQSTFTPQQLDDLVAPVALYPDPILSQVLAASTYPIEIAEAEQWLRDHPKWKPSKLMDEAKKQNWDPSIQGLVAFPDVLARLSGDISYTTQLGNAFLAQQADVMQAVQRMRAQAQKKGTLKSTPQETVATQDQNGQNAITIEPTDPNVWYVPYYNPLYVWGPPVWGVYPPLLYPGIDIGWGWYPGIDIGLYFGGWGGWGWGGWGWGFDWFGGGIFINHSFFHRFGFQHFDHGESFGRSAWAHDPAHRLGVPYGNRAVADRFSGSRAFGGGDRGFGGGDRGFRGGGAENFNRGGEQRFGSSGFEQRGYTDNHSVFGGYHDGGATRTQSDHGFSSLGGERSGGGFGGGGFRGGGFGGGGGFHGGGGGRR
jgi:hypothetical protein